MIAAEWLLFNTILSLLNRNAECLKDLPGSVCACVRACVPVRVRVCLCARVCVPAHARAR